MWILINRLHMTDIAGYNNWKALRRYLNRQLFPLEITKALVMVRTAKGGRNLQIQLSRYNKKYHTDFFI